MSFGAVSLGCAVFFLSSYKLLAFTILRARRTHERVDLNTPAMVACLFAAAILGVFLWRSLGPGPRSTRRQARRATAGFLVVLVAFSAEGYRQRYRYYDNLSGQEWGVASSYRAGWESGLRDESPDHRNAEYHERMMRAYERAAVRPWLVVRPPFPGVTLDPMKSHLDE
jgi:hypothetical protein